MIPRAATEQVPPPPGPPSGSRQPVSAKITTNPWIILVSLRLGFFMILLDTTTVNVAAHGAPRVP